jgi:hypothetical protein
MNRQIFAAQLEVPDNIYPHVYPYIEHRLYRELSEQITEVLKRTNNPFAIRKNGIRRERMDEMGTVRHTLYLEIWPVEVLPYKILEMPEFPTTMFQPGERLVVWFCGYCGTANHMKNLICTQCGHGMTQNEKLVERKVYRE